MDDRDAAIAARSTVDLKAPLEQIRGRVAAVLFGGPSPLPETIGRFRIDRELGSGGMGIVYAAHDPQLDRTIAVKVLRRQDDGPSEGARLLREAQAMARLRHRNVLTVYEAGDEDGQIFVAMEYALGGTLAEWIDDGPRPWREVLDVLIPAGRGLWAAHQAGLVHRDFKPANVLLDGEGNALVSDFGLARAGGEPEPLPDALEETQRGDDSKRLLQVLLTRTGALVGTPAYMSPEQFAGLQATPRSDQFAYCVVLHEALYGRRPFAGHSVAELIAAIDRGEVIKAPRGVSVPSAVRAVILRGLARDPSRRFPSMSALLDALERARRSAGWRPLQLVGGGAAALMLVMGAVYTIDQPSPPPPPAGAAMPVAVTLPGLPPMPPRPEAPASWAPAGGIAHAIEAAAIASAKAGVAVICEDDEEHACVVTGFPLRYYIEHPAAIEEHATFAAAIRDGAQRGYAIEGVRPGSILTSLGFREGDVVTAIDGVKLTSADVAVAALSRGQALAGIFQVGFEREGAARELSLVVVPTPEGMGPPSPPAPVGPPTISIGSLEREGARVTIHGGDAAGHQGPRVTIVGEDDGERAEITIHGPPAPVEPPAPAPAQPPSEG